MPQDALDFPVLVPCGLGKPINERPSMLRRVFSTNAFALGALGVALIGPTACNKQPPPPPAPSADATPAEPNAADTYKAVFEAFTNEERLTIGKGAGSDAILARHAADIQRLIEASKSTHCDFGVDRSQGLMALLPHLAQARANFGLLKADAERLIKAGDAEGAATRVVTMLRIAAHVCPAEQSMIEVLTGTVIAKGATELVIANPSFAQTAARTELLEAMGNVTRGGVLNSRSVIRNEGVATAALFASGPTAVGALGAQMKALVGDEDWSSPTPARMEDGAKKLAALAAEAEQAWSQPGAVSKLKALSARAKAEKVATFFGAYDKVKKMVEELQSSVGQAQMALRK